MWRKVLYERQPFADNYVESSSFLKDLERNLYRSKYSIQDLLVLSNAVVHPVARVFLFVSLFYHLDLELLSPYLLLASSGLLFVGSVAFFVEEDRERLLKLYVFLHVFLRAVCPVLCTLTKDISSDTLWAMSIGMLFFHLVFYNYERKRNLLYKAVSLNASVFAAICLASMMKTAMQGFVLVSLSIHLFALPALGNKSSTQLTLVLVFVTACLLLHLSCAAMLLFIAIILSLSIFFPLWLHSLQDMKDNIYGPWDEAVVDQSTSSGDMLH